jgi:uncharacterized protein (DUF2236 family)
VTTGRAVPDERRLRHTFDPMMLHGATANVIMQLAMKPVGHGVVKSPVESGNIIRHPWKRLRTTLSYLAVATLGTEEDKQHYREAVDAVHRQVRSAPGAAVKYNAFDKDLQLWVAACIYMGFKLGYEALHGAIPEDIADHVYDEAATFGTTLQVTRDMWPADRAAFDIYWAEGLARCEVDDVTRAYLRALTDLKHLRPWYRWAFVPMSRFMTVGFLPPMLRDQMQMEWSDRQQARFDRFFRACGRLSRLQPGFVREFPYNVLIIDVRRRIRSGRPLV